MQYTKVLTIAGSDSGGGAGIQADLKTFAALGCYGLSVITALTAQNTLGVQAVHMPPVDFIAQQLDSVLQDIGANAIKIGMLSETDIIHKVAERLKHYVIKPIIVDPVMVAKGGYRLLKNDAINALRDYLLPITTLLTPNIPEAECLLETTIRTRSDMLQAAKALSDLGPDAVLLKGGHLLNDNESADYLYIKADQEGQWFKETRIYTQNTHGTGCTLSAAIAAFLAHKTPLIEAVAQAKSYLTSALQAGSKYRLGEGHAPVHHFYQYWE